MMTAPFSITPSLMAYHDWVEFKDLLQKLDAMPIDGLHIDVMDGHFVPNLAFGPDLVRSVKQHTKHPLDVHLMINCLDTMLKRYIDIKPRVIFIHPDIVDVIPDLIGDPGNYINMIRSNGIQTGFAIHPDYPIELTKPFWDMIDRMLIMTVYPGFSGQTMLPQHLEKVRYLKENGYKGLCFVDGGVSAEKFNLLQQYHVDGAVMGNSFFTFVYN